MFRLEGKTQRWHGTLKGIIGFEALLVRCVRGHCGTILSCVGLPLVRSWVWEGALCAPPGYMPFRSALGVWEVVGGPLCEGGVAFVVE